ncbi:MAG: DNA methyltransferase [Cytophagales bacterium]|nr:MAG: DNA methyltransferase [Cytophagales bacterium]
MSIARINQYYNEIHEAQQFSGSKKETSIRRYFAELLNFFAKEKHLRLVDEIKIPNSTKQPDGVLIDIFKYRYGYWEAKDLQDDFEKELNNKIKIGYPTENLLFENSKKAMLIRGDVRETCDMTDAKALQALLLKFVSFEKKEAKDFKEAVEIFRNEVGEIARVLKKMIENFVGTEQNLIDTEKVYNKEFVIAHSELFELCKLSINPTIAKSDINEMIVQHILTGDIFRTIFDDAQYLDENNIAMALNKIEKSFFTGNLKRSTLQAIQPYYRAIKGQAAALLAHEEKQDFLKTIYENFYQAYNPKGADKLGIVYTPSEIVNFMLDSTEYLLEKHFDKTLSDKGVEILDPATGTGTFITHLIKKLSPHTLKYKYEHELHANEVAILPYYIANLNIEYIYRQKMGEYCNFNNICWVDTLDNTDALAYKNQQKGLFKDTSMLENYQRIQNQNSRPLTVIIGNPPYNANQQNENDSNKNREYYFNYPKKEGGVDGRIKETYVAYSQATKTKVYDMYARFYRWASDRMKNDGIIAFVTNRSFIDSGTYDGFRKCIRDDFDFAYILDTQSDVRKNPKIAGTTHNVFGIQTGVAIMFLIKKQSENQEKLPCKIFYHTLTDEQTKIEKLQWLKDNPFPSVPFERIQPDENNHWINLSVSDFKTLLPIIQSDNENKEDEKLFHISTIGVNTARDEWVFDFSKGNLEKKIAFFVKKYNEILEQQFVDDGDKTWRKYLKKHKDKNGNGKNGNGKPQLVNEPENWDTSIKWSESLKNYFLRNGFLKDKKIKIIKKQVLEANYRPFTKQFYYANQILSDRLTRNHYAMFGENLDKDNKVICFSGLHSSKPFQSLAVNKIMNFDFLEKTNCLPFYTYLENGERVENITDWGLAEFQQKYSPTPALPKGDGVRTPPSGVGGLSKLDIFHYIYAVLHSPAYRKTYELDLKREFPRIPLYDDFWKYAEAGKKLMDLHINYESVMTNDKSQLLLERKDIELAKFLEKLRGKKPPPAPEGGVFGSKEKIAPFEEEIKEPKIKFNPILKIKDGNIEIDELTMLCGIPTQALAYKLGNRSAIEWILDQYKPYKSDDKTIQEQFNNYNFADYKEEVIELLQKVCYVSVETIKIVGEL